MESQSSVGMRSEIGGTRAREGSVDDKEEQEDEEESQRSCGGASINGGLGFCEKHWRRKRRL